MKYTCIRCRRYVVPSENGVRCQYCGHRALRKERSRAVRSLSHANQISSE
nr:DNA-directed RNA polymerase subunit P [Haladaptatus pallidirubidus]